MNGDKPICIALAVVVILSPLVALFLSGFLLLHMIGSIRYSMTQLKIIADGHSLSVNQ